MKKCIKCKKTKHLDLFPRRFNTHKPNNHRGACKECYNEYIREWNKSDSPIISIKTEEINKGATNAKE